MLALLSKLVGHKCWRYRPEDVILGLLVWSFEIVAGNGHGGRGGGVRELRL